MCNLVVCALLFFSALITKVTSSCAAPSSAPISLTVSNVTIDSQDTATYGIRLDVGLPRRALCLTPSTVVDNTQLIASNICNGAGTQNLTLAQCRSYHGGLFDMSTAGAAFQNVSVSSAGLPADEGWTSFNPAYTVAGRTSLGLVANDAISNMTVVVITEGINFTAGHLGLGKNSVLLHTLKENKQIPTLGFGLNAGSQSVRNPRDGNLVLGGYDAASITSTFHDYPMNYSDTLAGRYCPLQVRIQGLQLLVDGRSPMQLIGDGDGHLACIEP
jgi:hypothetical protein